MYDTGDIGRWREDGEIEHLGRVDEQVKIKVYTLRLCSKLFLMLMLPQGFRVELVGVAATMCAYISRISLRMRLGLESELWGFYNSADISADDVRKATTLVQPYYDVWEHARGLPTLPLTP